MKSTGNKEYLFEFYLEMEIPDVSKVEEYKIIEGRWKPEFRNKGFVTVLTGGRVWSDWAVISPDNKLLWDASVEFFKTPEM